MKHKAKIANKNRVSHTKQELLCAFKEGQNLSFAEAAAYETTLEMEPYDLHMQAKLLGFYYKNEHEKKYARQRIKKISWLIKNYPDHPFLGDYFCRNSGPFNTTSYKSISGLWLKQIKYHPKNAQILANVAAHLASRERAIANELALSAKKIDFKNETADYVLSRIKWDTDTEAEEALDPEQLDKLVTAWIAAQETESAPEGDLNWAIEKVIHLAFNDPQGLWQFIVEACNKPMSDKARGSLAAGAVEDLIGMHGEEYIDKILKFAKKDDNFKDILGGVWQLDESKRGRTIWKRIEAIRGEEWD